MKSKNRLLNLIVFVLLILNNPVITFGYPSIYLTGTTIYNAQEAYNGLNIFVLLDHKEILLINMKGDVIYSWQLGHDSQLYYVKPLANGNILTADFPERRVVELDWDSNICLAI